VNIVVLIAGVHDPKWPIGLGSGEASLPIADHQILSPFDEAAIEIALRIRDAHPDTRIAAYVAGGSAGVKIARAVIALNIANVFTFELAAPWDQSATARALASLCEEADLILIGREFGDFDDGMVPALLAGVLDIPFFARAQTIETHDDLRLMREVDSCVETFKPSGQLLVSVTNDRRTRLRKPLMKNVMQARQATIGEAQFKGTPSPDIAITSIKPRNAARSQTCCDMISGSMEIQANTIAKLLWEARP